MTPDSTYAPTLGSHAQAHNLPDMSYYCVRIYLPSPNWTPDSGFAINPHADLEPHHPQSPTISRHTHFCPALGCKGRKRWPTSTL